MFPWLVGQVEATSKRGQVYQRSTWIAPESTHSARDDARLWAGKPRQSASSSRGRVHGQAQGQQPQPAGRIHASQAAVKRCEGLRHVCDDAIIEDEGSVLWSGTLSLVSKELLRELVAAGGIH